MVAMRRNDWANSIDLKDAYFHVLVAQRSRKYMRFVIDGMSYQFQALPFGFSTAPLVFTHIMNEVAAYVHRKGIRLHIYLDDWLLWSLDSQQLQQDMLFMLDLCALLDLIVNILKSNLTPSQEFIFLGIYFQTVSFICHPSTDRWKRLLTLLRHARNASSLCARQWIRLVGTLMSMDSQVPLDRLHRRPIQLSFRDCSDRRKWSVSADTACAERSASSELVVMSVKRNGRPVISGAIHEWSDDLHWSMRHSRAGEPTPILWQPQVNGLCSGGCFAINWLELEAIRLALVQSSSKLLLMFEFDLLHVNLCHSGWNTHCLIYGNWTTLYMYIGSSSKKVWSVGRGLQE